MRTVVQRVLRASVSVDDRTVGSIERGFLVLLGVTHDDTVAVAAKLADKVAGLGLFEDDTGRMNLRLEDVSGAVLCVSQFTLYGDVRRGRRPSFDAAASGDTALPLYEAFCAAIESAGIRCERGVFGAHMQVDLVNDGPVTLILDSHNLDTPAARRDPPLHGPVERGLRCRGHLTTNVPQLTVSCTPNLGALGAWAVQLLALLAVYPCG